MKNKLHKIIDNKLYIFFRAKPQEIDERMGMNWSDEGKYFINASDTSDIELAIRIWEKTHAPLV